MLPVYFFVCVEEELWIPGIHIYDQKVLAQWLCPNLVFDLIIVALWICELGGEVGVL